MLGANQISIEHRFFAPSRPEPADWSDDAIVQMAADEHAIVAALRSIYAGPVIATGASKGGMTAVFYRRFFPDDVVATVPYVAPISYGAPDPRYDHVFDAVGPADGACRQAIRDAATDMLANRRDALHVQRAHRPGHGEPLQLHAHPDRAGRRGRDPEPRVVVLAVFRRRRLRDDPAGDGDRRRHVRVPRPGVAGVGERRRPVRRLRGLRLSGVHAARLGGAVDAVPDEPADVRQRRLLRRWPAARHEPDLRRWRGDARHRHVRRDPGRAAAVRLRPVGSVERWRVRARERDRLAAPRRATGHARQRHRAPRAGGSRRRAGQARRVDGRIAHRPEETCTARRRTCHRRCGALRF